MAEAARLKDAGLAAALELTRLMGLRSQEAVRCSGSLKTWREALEKGDTRLSGISPMAVALWRICHWRPATPGGINRAVK